MLSQSEQRLRTISLLTLIGGVGGLSVLDAVLFALYSARRSRREVSAANAQLMHAARHASLTDLSNRAHYRGTWVL